MQEAEFDDTREIDVAQLDDEEERRARVFQMILFEPAEDAAKRAADIERFLKDTNERYGEVLKRLAE